MLGTHARLPDSPPADGKLKQRDGDSGRHHRAKKDGGGAAGIRSEVQGAVRKRPRGNGRGRPGTQTLRYANPAMCKMFGYTEEEFLGLGVPDIHPGVPELRAGRVRGASTG